ncbi:LysM peptidoglycan-binding domain-containing protein [Kineococcus sp. SYSU DK003]|uniref:LysM peptidoglycan-binding domain-containing protein n=1 Tax=Kineococcus sp. SYSU DK003 TaxID=3383124 RepID=UPI003D7D83C8
MSTATPVRPRPRPVPRLPRAPLTRRARAGEVLRGLLAAAVLLTVLAGVPYALVVLVGNPLPTSAPSRSWLEAELSVSAVLDVLAAVLWLVWGHFVVCVLAEFRSWAVGDRSGAVPFGGANQVFAQRLVAAVLLLAAGAVWVPGTVSVLDAVPVSSTTATSTPTSTSEPASGPVGGAESGAARAETGDTPRTPDAGWAAGTAVTARQAGESVAYVVHPPQGRYHDCLWDIAERTLGDPLRYREIFELNEDRVQPDGSRLVDADLIRPGWVLLLPADAVGATATPLAPAPVAAPSAPDENPPTGTGAETAAEQDVTARAVLSGGLLLAGVSLALRRGSRAANDLADELGDQADPERAEFLDRALRHLVAARTAAELPLPEVVAAHLSAGELVLHLGVRPDGAAAQPPQPWTVLDGGAWRVRREDLPASVPQGVPAPYPALVDVARSGEHEVLVDLESAPGIVAVGGHADTARDVVTSMVAELATNTWSDGVDVHLVGFGDELGALAPDAVHTHLRLEELLDRWDAAGPGQPAELLTGRAARAADRVRPQVVAVSGRPTDEQVRRLSAFTAGGRTPVAVLCVGDVPAASWRFAVSEAGTLDLGVLGLQGRARRLPPAEYRRWIAALRS